MPIDYANNSVWGSDYRRAIANGDTAYAQKLQTAMDAQPQAANTAGMISANHLMTNYNPQSQANTWMNGAEGQQVNGLGQIRTAQPTQGWNVGAGTNGNLYKFNGQSAPAQPSQIIGQAMPTTPMGGSSVGGGLLGATGPQFGPQRNTFGVQQGQASAYKPASSYSGYQSPFGWGGGGQFSNNSFGNASPYRRGGLL